MVEEVMIDDMEARGVFVTRNSKFVSCSRVDGTTQLDIVYEDVATSTSHKIRADYLVGCDGSRSKVRSFIPDAELDGELTNEAWGVLDDMSLRRTLPNPTSVIDTDFPDLWSKVALRSHFAGTTLCIPRERGMTRLYVELSSTDEERVEKSKATTEHVMGRAKEAMHPFSLEWKTVEWFVTYVVGQRVAKRFMDSEVKISITGDVCQTRFKTRLIPELTYTQAGHYHSALAAQGANTSMHDSFNLAWKLNLVARGLASPYLLHTYEAERQKIAYDLTKFDFEHCKAFAAGDAELAKNFDDHIRFTSGVGAEYAPGMLTQPPTITSPLKPGMLQLPAKVTRYIDANPIDIQLDIPLLGQFKIYIFVPDLCRSRASLKYICQGMQSILASVSVRADQSYEKHPKGHSPSDEFVQAQRYIAVFNACTFAMVTQSTQSEFEFVDLPEILQTSRWTLYVDNIGGPSCTNKWFGGLNGESIGIAVLRPDGYVGAIDTWNPKQVGAIGQWVQDYLSFMV
ncbi:Monooxygenase FAD-binding [Penicillium concentricum]|uniref:Monooxygenase FAD-binding n=1 Tax=Penicillium concentricum TaxID=293559 RepID=A0A9W9UU85_9EURO|nr:Monooxygenase FAD-binding [Penicillium concentricum]KAJ5355660.1 Monooxygenase FAD-binding [Penicillium concentricum]